MSYKDELVKLVKDRNLLIAQNAERRTEYVSATQKGQAISLTPEAKRKMQAELDDVKRYLAWKISVLQDKKFHVVAKLSLMTRNRIALKNSSQYESFLQSAVKQELQGSVSSDVVNALASLQKEASRLVSAELKFVKLDLKQCDDVFRMFS